MTTPTLTEAKVEAILAEWRTLARQAISAASTAHDKGDAFGASLITARREVRLKATTMLTQAAEPMAAAKEMHQHARALHQTSEGAYGTGYDAVAIKYTQARAWQACARAIDPSLPEVQRRWT